ncbi:hypothetical protein PsorP6_011495 [Peronosclerospora sorghi]|uniref:Uncharacterized protein n=1 Tax=Peronosclerospora sorghi TaxID=230839 RepID=A0ACC0WM41_9STRA|nr:hypothetical protein PsorP6_011495 [Peronosclerospora sorghi]
MATSSSPLTLRHVLIFHRHGDRTPVVPSIGSNVFEDKDVWAAKVATPEQLALLSLTAKPVGADETQAPTIHASRDIDYPYGLLTHQGVEHMIAKGRALRERYGSLFIGDVKREDVYVLSSNVPRTIESVQSLLRGFFYDEAKQQAQDVPEFLIHTYPRNVLAPQHSLRVFLELERLLYKDILTLRSEAEQEATHKLARHVRACMGIPDDEALSWTGIRDTLTCRKAHGMPFPEGVDDKIFDQVEAYDTWLWQRLYHDQAFCHKAFQDGVHELYTFLKTVRTTKQPAKLSFFSAHDNSVVALLAALQIDVGAQLPRYGTMLALELLEDEATHEFYLQPRYENEPVTFAGHKQDLPCPFSLFESLVLEFLSYKANGPC